MLFILLIICVKGILFQSNSADLLNQGLNQITYDSQILQSIPPIISLVNTLPYIQICSLALQLHSTTRFSITLAASSSNVAFSFTSVRIAYVVLGYYFRYLNTFNQVIDGLQQTHSHSQSFSGSGNCQVSMLVLGFSMVDVNSNMYQSSIYTCTDTSITYRSIHSAHFQSVTYSILRIDANYQNTGSHSITVNTYQYSGNYLTIDPVQPKNYRFYIIGVTQISRTDSYFHFSLIQQSNGRLRVDSVAGNLNLKLQQVSVLNYPSKLAGQLISPQLEIGKYYNPTTSTCTPIGICQYCFQPGVCQSLKLYYYYNTSTLSCQHCMNLCISCVEQIRCLICTASASLNLSRTQCTCQAGFFQGTTVDINIHMCFPCVQNCLICVNMIACLQCLPTYTLSLGHCYGGSGDSSIPSCAIGLYNNPSTLQCLPCESTCLYCINKQSCLCSKIRHYLIFNSITDVSCPSCQTGCQFCISVLVCSACILQAELRRSQCVCLDRRKIVRENECVPCNSQCIECLPDNTCSCFKLGQFVNQFGLCEICNYNCIRCLVQDNCLECEKGNYLINGICFEQCRPNSTFSRQTLNCVCDIPFYTTIERSKVSCYLDRSLMNYSRQMIQKLVAVHSGTKNISKQLGNSLTVLMMVGVASLIGQIIESFTILKIHLFYLVPIHPFLQIFLNIFQKILSAEFFGKLLALLQQKTYSPSVKLGNYKLAHYTNYIIFVVNTFILVIQITSLFLKQLLLLLITYVLKPKQRRFPQRIAISIKCISSYLKELISCSKIQILIFISIQLQSFNNSYSYYFNLLLCVVVFTILLLIEFQIFNRIYKKGTKTLFLLAIQLRTIHLACFILFGDSVYSQSIPPIIINLIIVVYLFVIKSKLKANKFRRNLFQTCSILMLQMYLLAGVYFSEQLIYSYLVYLILAGCALHVIHCTIQMLRNIFSFLKRMLKRVMSIKKRKKKFPSRSNYLKQTRCFKKTKIK